MALGGAVGRDSGVGLAQQSLDAGPADPGDGEDPATRHRRQGAPLLGSGRAGQRVALVEGDDLGLAFQSGAVGHQLAAHRGVISGHVVRRAVDQVDEQPATLHVAEKPRPQPGALVGAFDESRNVGQYDGIVVDADHAQVGMKRREGVIGDLGPGA